MNYRQWQGDSRLMDWNFCPMCGHRIYQHQGPATFSGKWDGGCAHVETTGHVLQITKTRWTLKHPVAERESDQLFDCPIHRELATWDQSRFPKVGEYALVESGSGGWTYEPPDKARTRCDCTVPYDALREHRI